MFVVLSEEVKGQWEAKLQWKKVKYSDWLVDAGAA
jgi:hypothetical protein